MRSLIPLLLVAMYTVGNIRADSSEVDQGTLVNVVWTNEEEANLLTEEEHKVAFRDVVLEKLVERIINTWLENSRLGPGISRMPANILLEDPINIPDISFKRAQSGLFDINFKARNLRLSGIHATRINNLHILRHLGLKDIRVVGQVVIPLLVEGEYELVGTGLSLLPFSGYGNLTIEVSDFMLTGETYLVYRDDQLFIREFDVQMTHNGINVNLQNLLGDGLVGSVANSILDTVGEDVLYSNRDMLLNTVVKRAEREINNFINI